MFGRMSAYTAYNNEKAKTVARKAVALMRYRSKLLPVVGRAGQRSPPRTEVRLRGGVTEPRSELR